MFHCPIPISVLLPLVIIHIIHCPHVSLFYTNNSPTVTGHNSHYPLPHVSLSDTNISPVTGHNLHYPLSPCVTVLIPISVLLLVTIHIVHCPHVSLSDTNTSPTVTCQYSHCPLPHVSLSDTNTSPTVTGHNSHYPLSPCFAV